MVETLGRRSLGGGGIRILVEDLKWGRILINPEAFDIKQRRVLKRCFDALASVPVHSVIEEIHALQSTTSTSANPRIVLDKTVFDVLNLNKQERIAVYEAVIDLVEKRLGKAKSVKER